MPDIPTTAEVLTEIGAAGVVVGSVARGSLRPKDIDIVVRPRGARQHNLVFQKISARWPDHVDSECIGHLTVKAVPLNVELFEHQYFPTGSAIKDAGRVSFARAKRCSAWQQLLGIVVLVQQV